MTRNVGYIREMGLFQVIINFQREKQQYFLLSCTITHIR